ncbi:MAG: AAA family ATPase [Candidatus Electrothrix sp. AX5]|nr:AAA family ATPase [Candidatus Electrothrix sp. AX5]
MELEVKHCNNLDYAKIRLSKNKLNIKFAPNGTGKTTISTAIQYSLENSGNSLENLKPFKLRESNPDNSCPHVRGIDHFASVMSFNEDYVNQFTFQPEELLSNSFDIFIRDDFYKKLEQEIEKITHKIKTNFSDNSEVETLKSDLKELSGAFKLTKTGLSKASKGMKGLSCGNKIQHIPTGLEPFSPFIQSEKNVSWIDWQIKGYAFSELATSCPFCTSDATGKKEQIQRIGQEYNKTIIKNLIDLIKVVDKLGNYLSTNTQQMLSKITTLKESPEKKHEIYLVNVKEQLDEFVDKLEKLKMLSGFDFKAGENVTEKLNKYRLDLHFFSHLDSSKTREAVSSINKSIDELIDQAGLLQGKINRQRSSMQKVIGKHQEGINDFLKYAGYRYKVELSGSDDNLQLKLLHSDYNEHIAGGRQHFSFGERNAFAIVLFMYECLSKCPDLIILDDPISSFDKNKKYAILEKLFRQHSKSCLKGKTVLMLTHDIEPIIDTIKTLKQFCNQTTASHLRYSHGIITESFINANDIQTFGNICDEIIKSNKDIIIKLIYLRRYYEITEDKGDAYQVISNLLHKRTSPKDFREEMDDDGNYPMMDDHKFNVGCDKIKNRVSGFNYDAILNLLLNFNFLHSLYNNDCQNGYEKLQLFRFLLPAEEVKSSVIRKFINETYHIENEFICQLNPNKFDTIPEYVIEECNKELESFSMIAS